MKPDGRDIPVIVAGMYDREGTPRESAPHPREIMDLDLRKAGDPLGRADVETGDILRVVMHGPDEEK
jgi:putative protease